MDYATISRQAIARATNYIRASIKRDANNLYSLKIDWTLPLVKLPLPDYDDEAFEIVGDGKCAAVTVKAFESTPDDPKCDGASMAPDKFLGVDFVAASVFHDRWYDRMETIAKEWSMPLAQVRRIGDQIFASVILAENEGRRCAVALATIYYRAVRMFGGIYHGNAEKIDAARHAVTAILVVALLAAISGCVGSVFDGGDEYTPPQVEKVR